MKGSVAEASPRCPRHSPPRDTFESRRFVKSLWLSAPVCQCKTRRAKGQRRAASDRLVAQSVIRTPRTVGYLLAFWAGSSSQVFSAPSPRLSSSLLLTRRAEKSVAGASHFPLCLGRKSRRALSDSHFSLLCLVSNLDRFQFLSACHDLQANY